MHYLCCMETMIKKFCKKYKLPESTLHELLSHMTEVRFGKRELIISEGERNSNFYLLKKGIWRAYYLTDGTENSLWFAAPGDTACSSWGYVDSEVSPINIESVNESIAYCISKPELEALFSHSIDMANFGRRIFEREILSVDSSTVAYGTPPTAKETVHDADGRESGTAAGCTAQVSGFLSLHHSAIPEPDTRRIKEKVKDLFMSRCKKALSRLFL